MSSNISLGLFVENAVDLLALLPRQWPYFVPSPLHKANRELRVSLDFS